MEPDYKNKIINNNNNIIKNQEEINNYYNEFNTKYEIYDNYEKFDIYKTVGSFSALFNGTVQSFTIPKTTSSTPSNIRPNQQVQSTPSQASTPNSGRAYDASTMWSPQSFAGNIYEWNRGVVGISLDGNIKKENLDGTFNHHADATVRVAAALGSPIEKTTAPFEAAINCTNNGLLIFQSEGDNAFVYFPSSISEEQLYGLTGIVIPRSGFNFSYTHDEKIYEEQTVQDVINFAMNLNVMATGPRM